MAHVATPILLIGADGMLGTAWSRLLESRGLAFEPALFPPFDMTQPDMVRDRVRPGIALVINCAAYTNVDKAEEEESLATKINADGPRLLAGRCRELGIPLVHYSTDYVFAGNATVPYTTDHPRDPIGAYGRSKAAGEIAIEQAGCAYLLIRTSWLYAPWANNFVRTIARLAQEKPTLKVVNDQRGRPTSAEHLAAMTLELLEQCRRGTFHVTDGGECTWFEFAAQIAANVGADCDVQPCTTAEFPRPAKRPAYSVLDLTATEAAVGPMPHWRSNLASVTSRLIEKATTV